MNKKLLDLQKLKMVESLKEKYGIEDTNVLASMIDVPRHLFVPLKLENYAYIDGPLDIGYGQTISQPFIVAFMTQSLDLNKNSKVLEIGTGSGYQAAVLSRICMKVYSIEIIRELGIRTKKLFDSLGYSNIETKIDDGHIGWPEKSPFDAVIITASANEISQDLLTQLKVGGHMIMPIKENKQETLILLTKTSTNNDYTRKDLMEVRFVPMTRM